MIFSRQPRQFATLFSSMEAVLSPWSNRNRRSTFPYEKVGFCAVRHHGNAAARPVHAASARTAADIAWSGRARPGADHSSVHKHVLTTANEFSFATSVLK